jgi:hypothetical protein
LELHGLREKRIATLKARHQLELEEIEDEFSWHSLQYLKTKKFVDR